MTKLLVALALPLLLLAPPALAEDAAELADQISDLRKAEDSGGLATALKGAVAAYEESDASGQKKLRKEVAKVLKDNDVDESVRIAAIDVLIGFGDAKAAWKDIKRELPNPKRVEEETDLYIAAIKAAGTLAQRSAVKPLLAIVEDCKAHKLAAQAAAALGGFGAEKRMRTMILDELVSIGLRFRPGRSTDKNPSQAAIERWGIIAPGIVYGLNALTKRRETSFEDWEMLYQDNKRRLDVLFPQEDE